MVESRLVDGVVHEDIFVYRCWRLNGPIASNHVSKQRYAVMLYYR